MRKSLALLASVCWLAMPVFAQEEASITGSIEITETVPEKTDTSRITFDGSSYDFIFSWNRKAVKSHWTGFGFAFLQLAGLPDEVNLNLSRSHAFFLNIGDYIVPFNHNWLLATGLGFDWSRYHLRGNIALQAENGKTAFVPDMQQEYHASRLLVYYATIPLLLEYQTKINRKHSFFIYGGVEGLVKLYSKSQVDVRTPSGINKVDYWDLNLLPLNFRFTARAGIANFSIFSYYQPISMFEKGKGPELRSRGIGLMLNF